MGKFECENYPMQRYVQNVFFLSLKLGIDGNFLVNERELRWIRFYRK